jgi:hypothetical protein
MTFDIRKLATSQTAIMPIRDVDGNIQYGDDGKDPGIEFYAPGTKEYMRARHELTEKRRKQASQSLRGKEVKSSPEDDLLDTAEFLAKITKRLVNFDFPGGPKALYLDPDLGHITEDGDKFVGERGNFKPNSPKGSSNTSATQPG